MPQLKFHFTCLSHSVLLRNRNTTPPSVRDCKSLADVMRHLLINPLFPVCHKCAMILNRFCSCI